MTLRRALGRVAWLGLGAAALVLGFTSFGLAQGVTTAAVSGTVTDTDGNPVPNLTVVVTNESTGVTNGAVTNEDGSYYVPGLQIGGPYRIEASGLGYAPEAETDIRLTLGQRLDQDFELEQQAVELAEVATVVDPTSDQIINPSRTGQEQLITEHLLSNLPTIGRNFTDFIGLSPLIGTGGGSTSVSGNNNRFNNIQIDGVVTQDAFGLGSTGQPGGQADARSITIEAVKEYQILAAPFDVRQSGFTGGLINAVTKNGTNEWQASGYAFYRNEDFVRDEIDIAGAPVTFGEFSNRLIGGTLAGPIVRDRVHFFLAGEMEENEAPAGNVAVGRDPAEQTGVDPADAQRFADILSGLGVDPGEIGALTNENPNRNLFGRVDAQLNANHALTLRHNYVRAEDDVDQNRGGQSIYSLGSNFYFFENTTNSTVAQLNSSFGGVYNELTAGATIIRDRRTPKTLYPQINVTVPRFGGGATETRELRAGAEEFSQANELDQDVWDLNNNLSFNAGNHRITLGAQDQIFSFRNLFVSQSTGRWTFDNLDALEAGTPSRFFRSVPFEADFDPNAEFSVNQFSLYGQTEWRGLENLVVTGGLRYDVPFALDEPIDNPDVEDAFGLSTTETGDGNGILSPRLGFNWDVNGDRTTQVRGGVGLFTGRHPYVWLSNLFIGTGRFTLPLDCRGVSVPAFTLDPANQPTTCAGGGGPGSGGIPSLSLIDPDFEYPSAWRYNVAVDRELPWGGIVGTVEFLMTDYRKQVFTEELNVRFESPVSFTQGGRPVFGTHTATVLATGASNASLAQANRIDPRFQQVVFLTNSEEDNSWSFILQGQKRYSDGIEFSTSYTYSDAEEINPLVSSQATSNIGFSPVPGNPNEPPLATSSYETTHKLVLGGSYDVADWFTFSMFYVGNSGDKYSYIYDGDINADGYESANANDRNNDLLYVPTGPEDITLVNPASWETLNRYIESEDCLRENRGRILERNACDDPWRNRFDTRFTFRIPTITGQRAELVIDVLNFGNLLNEDWGRAEAVDLQRIELLNLRGWDEANNRGIFDLDRVNFDDQGTDDPTDDVANPFTTLDERSRWQAQIGLKYAVN